MAENKTEETKKPNKPVNIIPNKREDDVQSTTNAVPTDEANPKTLERWDAMGDPEKLRRYKEKRHEERNQFWKRKRKIGKFEFDLLHMLTYDPVDWGNEKKIFSESAKQSSADHIHRRMFWDSIWEQLFSRWFLSSLIMLIMFGLLAFSATTRAISAIRGGTSKLFFVFYLGLIIVAVEIAWNALKHFVWALSDAVDGAEKTIATYRGKIAEDKAKAEAAAKAEKERVKQLRDSRLEKATGKKIDRTVPKRPTGPIGPSGRRTT